MPVFAISPQMEGGVHGGDFVFHLALPACYVAQLLLSSLAANQGPAEKYLLCLVDETQAHQTADCKL